MSISSDTYVKILFTDFDAAVKNYIYDGYNALMSYVNVYLASLIIAAIIFMGYKLWFTDDLKIKDFAYFVAKVSFIYFFAVNWGNFSEYLMTFFQKGIIDGMGSAIMTANPIKIPNVDDIESALQLTSDLVSFIGSSIISHAGFSTMSYIFYGGFVYISGFVLILIAMIEIVVAKIMMAALFVIAPAIIPCCLFKYTQGIFDRWIGNLIGFSLLLVLISAVLGIGMSIIYSFLPITSITAVLPDHFFNGLSYGIIPMLASLIIVAYSLTKITSVAMHIGGGASSAGLGAIAGGMMIGAAMSSTKSMAHPLAKSVMGGAGRTAGSALRSGVNLGVDGIKSIANKSASAIKNYRSGK